MLKRFVAPVPSLYGDGTYVPTESSPALADFGKMNTTALVTARQRTFSMCNTSPLSVVNPSYHDIILLTRPVAP